MKILYITDGFTRLSVFRSQVHTLCSRHARNHAVHMGVFARLPEYGDAIEDGVPYTWSRSLLLPKAFVPEINRLSALLSGLGRAVREAEVIHCRGHVGTGLGLALRARHNPGAPLVADIRGAIVQELAESPSPLSRALAGQALRLERRIFSGPDWFFFVSENMRRHYAGLYAVAEGRSSVFPTVVDDALFHKDGEAREAVRADFGWAGKYVYAYSGGVDHWQNMDLMLHRFAQAATGRGDLALLLLVTDPEGVGAKVRALGLDEEAVRVMHVPYEAVGRYLNAADAGLVIRKDTLVNRVASPTKVNEYAACGLRIITDPERIGDTANPGGESAGHVSLDEIVAGQDAVYRRLAAMGGAD